MVIEIRRTSAFLRWIDGVRDRRARAAIAARITRLAFGNPGDAEPVGEGVSELRIHYGPGYRVYYVQRGNRLVILLCGSVKNDQGRAIKEAKRLAAGLED